LHPIYLPKQNNLSLLSNARISPWGHVSYGVI